MDCHDLAVPSLDGDLPVGELVRRARRGDPAAFEPLARRHMRAAYAVALAVLGRPADAEDVAQEAFVVAIERLDRCRDPDRFSGWLLEIVRTRALNALARRKRGGPSPADVDDLGAHPGPPGDSSLHRRLLDALATLTAPQREVVLLHDLEGWTHAEIAEALDLSEVNCRQHLFTARRALRRQLAALEPEALHG
jgi:RNA polymerase sigma-70 factor (ECF subfamily)